LSTCGKRRVALRHELLAVSRGSGFFRAPAWHAALVLIILEQTQECGRRPEGPAMQTFGQIVFVEERPRDGTKYRIAVFRVRGGLQGKWSCESCALEQTEAQTFPALDECILSVKDGIEAHHAAKHR
jgi:hypothetical protein